MFKVTYKGITLKRFSTQIQAENFIMEIYEKYSNHMDLDLYEEAPIKKWVKIG